MAPGAANQLPRTPNALGTSASFVPCGWVTIALLSWERWTWVDVAAVWRRSGPKPASEPAQCRYHGRPWVAFSDEVTRVLVLLWRRRSWLPANLRKRVP